MMWGYGHEYGTGGLGIVLALLFGLLVATFVLLVVWLARRGGGTRHQHPYFAPQAMAAPPAPPTVATTKTAAAPTAPTLEQRLAELTDLHVRGVITDDELAAARAAVLGG